LWKGRTQAKRFKDKYPQRIFFVAGLPKSGTTWLENMLALYPGATPILPPQVTSHEMKYKSSCEYDFPENIFEPLKKGIFVIKMHSHGSLHNVRILRANNIRYCILYRDLRDAAVSHYFYVRSTPWHPEYPEYRNLEVKEGLKHFCATRLEEWARWIKSWRVNRDKKNSFEITYEEMVSNAFQAFQRVARFFCLDDSRDVVLRIIDRNRFSTMKKIEGPTGGFFRKGISGDWKNYFDNEIGDLFKNKAGNLLIELGYEKNLHW
jgi:hypothetical protein